MTEIMMRFTEHTLVTRFLLATLLALQLAGCLHVEEDDTPVSTQIGGSVGDGPVTGATVTIYSSSGEVLGALQSDSNATYRYTVKARGRDYPLRLVATGGTDLVTGRRPDFEMVSVVAHPSDKHANINPFTTLIVDTAEAMPGGLIQANIGTATGTVMNVLGFGLDAAVVDNPVTTEIDDSKVAHIVKSSEMFGEMVRRTRDLMAGAGRPVDGDAVISTLGSDLVDGLLDGQGGVQANAALAAVARVVSSQVLLEAASNNLRVGGSVATQALDMSIISTHAGVTGSQLTGNVPVNRRYLDQFGAALAAARVLDPGAAVSDIASTAAGLVPGMLPGQVAAVLPVTRAASLDNALALAPVASPSDIDAVNQAATGDSGPVNTSPVISGTPATTVTAGNGYSFVPTAFDADSDTLTFSISNQPAWLNFSAATGRLDGTPSAADVGTYGNIVVSVTDGTGTVSLPAFAVEVVPVPVVNTPPVISGGAAGTVTAGDVYTFQPTASDVDGDALTFGISNRPSWASFDSATGLLEGAPSDTNVGTYGSIVISVTDGTDTVSLPAFAVEVLPAPVVNNPPVIGGTPPGTVTTGNSYVFQPSTSDADGDTLTFSISNRPAWASFDSSDGTLYGTPSSSQTGVYGNIVISVTDGTDTVSLPAFSIQVDASIGSITLGWTAPSTRADGTPLSLSDIDGYRVYLGTAPGNHSQVFDVTDGSATSAVISNIQAGTWYVSMSTVDANGVEGARSGEIAKVAN